MPAGYSTRCKVCNSPHRAEIEKWCKDEGLSPRAVAAKLLEIHGEKISHQSIWKHMNEHFDVKAEAREQYQRSKEQFKEAVKKRLSDIEMLDAVAQGDYELHQAARSWLDKLVKDKAKIPKSLVDLLATTAGEVRQQLKQKQAMLGEDPASKIAEVLSDLWEEEDEDES